MREFFHRIRLPALFAFLVVLTLVSMVEERNIQEGRADDRSWFRGVLFEVAVPVQQALTLPIHAATDTWRSYLALVELKRENDRLQERISALEEEARSQLIDTS